MKRMLTATTLVALAMTGCGGGGGSSNDSSGSNTALQPTGGTSTGSTSSLQGYWKDGTSITLITPSGDVWSIDTSGEVDAGTIASTSDNTFSASLTPYLLSDITAKGVVSPKATQQSITGSFTAKSSIKSSSGSISLNYSSNYDQSPPSATGTWALTSSGVKVMSMTVQSNGAFTLTASGCVLTGTLTASSGGKNYYNLHGTYGSGCDAPNTTTDGVALIDTKTSSTQMLAFSRVSGNKLQVFTGYKS